MGLSVCRHQKDAVNWTPSRDQ